MMVKKFSEFEIKQQDPVHKRAKYTKEDYPEWFGPEPITNTYKPERETDYIAKAEYLIKHGYETGSKDVLELASFLKEKDEGVLD